MVLGLGGQNREGHHHSLAVGDVTAKLQLSGDACKCVTLSCLSSDLLVGGQLDVQASWDRQELGHLFLVCLVCRVDGCERFLLFGGFAIQHVQQHSSEGQPHERILWCIITTGHQSLATEHESQQAIGGA